MPYIGAHPQKASDIKRQTITGSTSATHTLDWTPPNEQSLIVTINGVKQHDASYSITGTNTLTLTSALVSTDSLEIIGINDIGTTITPAEGSVGASHLADGAVTTAKMATDPTNASNLASGTVPTARLGSGTADATTFLRGDQSWATAGGDNTPSFGVNRATDFSVSQGTWTKLPFDTEDWDTDSAFDSSTNYRFTVPSGEGGKYLMWATARPTSLTYGDTKLRLYKNGSATDYQTVDTMDSNVQVECVAILDLSASDYIEWYLYLHGSGSTLGGGTMKASGFKLVGV